MPTHRRGRSLSDALTLEQSDEGALVVSSAVPNQGLTEGDEVLGATIDFEELSKDEVLHVLKLMEPFDDKIKVITRKNRSKSVGNLAECKGNPEEMLEDSYNRLYNAKIKKFMRNNLDEKSSLSGDVQAPTKLKKKTDMELPRLGVDFGLLKSRTLSQGKDEGLQPGDARELTYDTNLNLPPMGVGSNSAALVGAETQIVGYDDAQLEAPALKQPGTLSLIRPSMNTALPNVEGSVCENYSKGTFKAPEMGIQTKGLQISTPESKLKLKGGPEDDKKTEVSLSNIGSKYPKKLKNPGLNVDDPSSYVKSPKLRVSKNQKSPDLDGDLAPEPSLELPKPKARSHKPKLASNVQSNDIKGTSVKYTAPEFKMPKFDLPEIQIPNFSEDYGTPHIQCKAPQTKAGISPNLNLKGPKPPDIQGGIPAPDLDMPNMDLKATFDVNAPSSRISSPKTKLKMPKLKWPKFSTTGLNGPENDTNLNVPDMDVNTSKINLNGPNANFTKPDLDVGRKSGKIKMPNVNLGNLELSDPKLDGPNLDLSTPNFNVTGTHLEGGINTPDINGPKLSFDKMKMPDLHNPDWDLKASFDKLKPPKLNIGGTLPKGPNLDVKADVRTPDLNLRAPKIKGGIDSPELNMPNMDMEAPKFDVNAPGVSIGSPKSKFKMPKLNLPKMNSSELKGPIIDPSLEVPGMDVNASNLKGPKADVEIPDADFGGKSGKLKIPDVNVGNLELSGPKLDGPKIDLSAPNFDISSPHLQGAINAPGIDMPTTDLKGPKMNLHSPKLSVDRPSGKIKMPDLHTPDWDLKASFDKLKPPKLNLGGTLQRGSNLDLNADLGSPKLNLKAPKIKGGIDAPDMDLEAPTFDVNAPGINIDSPKSKFKMPKLKLPKFNLPGIKGSDIDGSLNVPEVDGNAPSVDLKGPKANVEMPDLDVGGQSGKLKMPNVNLGNLGFSGPKLDSPNLDFTPPNFDISSPHLQGAINDPAIDMPTTDIKGPRMDLRSPKFSLNRPSGKIKMPDLHTPDWDLKASFDKLKSPTLNVEPTLPKGPNLDLHTEVGAPDLNLKTPKIKGGIDAPDLDMPNMELKAPEFNSPKSKFKMPKLKLPKFNFLGIKGPDIDAGLNVPDMNGNAPTVDLKGPNADVEVPNLDVGGQSAKFKMPDVNLGDLNLSGLNLDDPNLKLKNPNFDVSSPHLESRINAPDMNMPTVDLNSPKIDLHAPKLSLDRPSGKLKMPDVHTPDWDLKASFDKLKPPKLNVGGTLPKGQNLDLNADLGTPDLNLRAPKIKGGIDAPDIDMPNMNVKTAKFSLDTPGVSIDSPKSKFKMPKLNLPKFSTTGLKGPDIDASLDVPDMDVNVPNVDLRGPKANVEMPDLDVGGLSGKLRRPHLNFDEMDLKAPKMDLHAPKFGLDKPTGEMTMPDLHTPDWDLKASFEKIKPPQLNVGGTLPRGPNLDLNAEVGTSDLNLKTPKIKGGIDGPILCTPDMDLKAPEFNSPKSKFKMPKLKLPKFNFPGIKGPDIDGDLDCPDKNIDTPNLNLKSPKTGLEIPDINFPGPSAGFETPNLNTNLPDFDFKDPKVQAEIDSPGIDLGLKSQKLDVNAPDINFGSPKTKMKFPKLHLPEKNLPNLKVPEVDGNLNSPNISIKAPTSKVKGSKPGFQMPDVDFGGKSEIFQLPHLKMPDVGFSSPAIETPRFVPSPPDISAKLPKEHNLNTSDIHFKVPKTKSGINTSNFNVNNQNGLDSVDVKMTKPLINTPKGLNSDLQGPALKLPNLDMIPQVKGEVRSPNFENDVPSKDFLAPQTDLDSVNKNMKLPSFKLPQLGSQDIRAGSDIDFGASPRLTSLDISPPNAKMYMKSRQLTGDMTGPNIIAPSVDHSIPKSAIPLKSSQKHVKNPDLNLDDAGKKMRSSYPVASSALGHHVDFNRSDLNIDDFTGKDHVLRARGSRQELRTSPIHKKVIPQSQINVDIKDPRLISGMPRGDIVIYSRPQKSVSQLSQQQTNQINIDSKNRVPKGSGGYDVTVLPTDLQNQKVPSRKRNTLGGTEFQATNMDLEVPNAKNDTKGSTFYFYDLV